MNIQKSIVLSAFVTALYFPLAGLSQATKIDWESGWYAGGGFGVASHPDDHPAAEADDLCGDDFSPSSGAAAGASNVATTDCEDSDSGFKIYVGKEFNENFAVEFGYADFGESSDDETAIDYGADGAAGGNDDLTGFVNDTSAFSSLYFAAVGIYPVSESVDLFAKLGTNSWDADLKTETSVGNFNFTESGSDLLYGVGAQWTSVSGFGVRGEWENFDIEDDAISFLSVSAYLQF